jgi:hypothetical protein
MGEREFGEDSETCLWGADLLKDKRGYKADDDGGSMG